MTDEMQQAESPRPVRNRLRLDQLDLRVSRTEPNALLLTDAKRHMLCIRFQQTNDLYDLTEFTLSEDEAFVTFDQDEYTRLLFWLRAENAAIQAPSEE